MKKSSDSGEHKLDLRLAQSNPSHVKAGRETRARASKLASVPPYSGENASETLKDSVDQMCHALDIVIGQMQQLSRTILLVLILMVTIALVQSLVLLDSNESNARHLKREIAEQVDKHPKIDIVPRGDGSASLVIETQEEVETPPEELPTRPAVPKPRKTKTVELQLDLETAALAQEN